VKALALILARGGSKGVPRKNAAVIAGKPCVMWTVGAAKDAEAVGRVVLSTDDSELARLARDAGVEVVERPAALASDTARVDDAARHAVERLDASGGLWTDPALPIVILYGNVPVRPAGLIDRAVGLMLKTGCDSVQSYSPVGKHHPWWTARVNGATGQVAPWEGDRLNHGVYRRQDLPAAFIPDGGVLVVSRRALFLRVPGAAPGPHAFFGQDRRGVTNPEGSVVDIDSPIDLIVAEAVLSGADRAKKGS
jgi:N-acylneuraminate cytidylyltransferase